MEITVYILLGDSSAEICLRGHLAKLGRPVEIYTEIPLSRAELVSDGGPLVIFCCGSTKNRHWHHALERLAVPRESIVIVVPGTEPGLELLALSGLHYLTTPIGIEAFTNVIDAILQGDTSLPAQAQPSNRVLATSSRSRTVIDLTQVQYIQGAGNYVTYYFEDGHKVTVTCQLGQLTKSLSPQIFLRTHQSFLVNVGFVQAVSTECQSIVRLKSGVRVPLARRRKAQFLKALKDYLGQSTVVESR